MSNQSDGEACVICLYNEEKDEIDDSVCRGSPIENRNIKDILQKA